ncbi:MAG: 2-succinyl-5-enolpyruvyl-6-hydroxy-3-cyclohexene-1-carboxylic-acid synthase [Bacteroidota bacterium]
MEYSNIPSARNLVLTFKTRNVKHIVISPGSRNAPLTLSFANDPFFECFSIVDERSAAFFAMGIAQQKREPVAVVCTSGSALLNYYPAVAEAFYSAIPLIVVSADRPPYKIDIGDGQTIRQDLVFDRHIGYSTNLKLDISHAAETIKEFRPKFLEGAQEEVESFNKSEVDRAIWVARDQQVPVHINIPFEEPLYGRIQYDKPLEKDRFSNIQRTTKAPLELAEARTAWATAKRKMVLVGVNSPDTITSTLLEILAGDTSVLVFTETTSNLHHTNFFPSIDSIIFPIEKAKNSEKLFNALQADILLTFGGLIVSKKVKAFLRKYKPKQHWHVSQGKAYDTYFALSKHFKTDANSFLKGLLPGSRAVKGDYRALWDEHKQRYLARRKDYLKIIPFSDFKAFDRILATIPEGYRLQLSNSSTVRYAQLFDIPSSVAVFCNRGTSGIDGSTSTAVGAAYHSNTPTVLITGDLSFFYDSNALWNSYVRSDFRILLINNSGGGIFRILPGFDGSALFSKYFETTHQLTAAPICEQFGLQYSAVHNQYELEDALNGFYQQASKAKVLEIFTPREANNKILLDYFDFISSDN